LSASTTIKLYLVDGQPDELRTAEISNWSGKAIAGSRLNLLDLRAREELAGPGIYFLIGEDYESAVAKVYVGEAENVSKRLASRQHADRDFWVSVIVFVSKDQNLTKAHIKYIEGELIKKGQSLGLSLDNGQASGAVLPESDAADMQMFLSKIYQLLPVLGSRHFEDPQRSSTNDDDWLYCTIKGLTAKGRRTASGFVVLKGSQAVLEHRASAVYTARRRDKLVDLGVMVPDGDNYVFARDYEFSSPSAAAAAVRGGATNGLMWWRTEAGIKLKDLE
jgi:hypothetical protein